MIAGTVVIERPESSLFCSARLLRTATNGNEGGSIILHALHPSRLAARVLCRHYEAFACGCRTRYQAARIRPCLIVCLHHQERRHGVRKHTRCHPSSCPTAAATKLGTGWRRRISDGLPDARSLQLPGEDCWRVPEARRRGWLEARLSQTRPAKLYIILTYVRYPEQNILNIAE